MYLEESFEAILGRKFNIHKTDRLLLAISGGKDSMSLFHLCTSLGYTISVAHCNFSLRGKESDDDALFVKNTCKQYNILLHEKKFDTKTFAHHHKMGTQEAARELRYAWFNELLATYSYDYILTAHHTNDIAETILMNISRGTGIKGLRGIPSQNGQVVRPLLHIKQKDIDTYVDQRQIAYRTDSSNETDHYTRNYVRHHIIPLLENINPQFIDHVHELSVYASEAQSIINKALEEFKKNNIRQEGEYIYISIEALLSCPAPSFYLYEILDPFGFNIDQVKSTANSLDSQSGNCFFSKSHQLLKDRSELILFPLSQEEQIDVVINKLPFNINTLFYHVQIEQMDASLLPSTFEKEALYLDISGVSTDQLIVRNWLPGDRFTPLGMSGSKKISDYLIDKKISLPHKKEALVLATKKDILALLPYQINEQYKLTADTTDFLKLRINKLY